LVIDGDSLSNELERHPNLRGILEEFFVERSRRDSPPEPVPVSAETPPASPIGLEDLIGIKKWDPRSRLRLADVLLRAGRHEEAGPILVSLADDFMQQGFPEKALAILKKTEALHRRRIGQLAGAASEEKAASPSPHSPTAGKLASTGSFDRWLVSLARDVVVRNKPDAGLNIAATAPTGRNNLAGYIPGLTASPLLSGLPAQDLKALMAELRLNSFEPGDIIVTEGETGDSVFILARGAVKVWVHDTVGRCVEVCLLEEGSFFGEIAGVLRQKRSATVTAADVCELLVLERTTLNRLIATHPNVAAVVGDYAARRSLDPRASAARTAADRGPA
jgi:CRP-like cAMP-binding protein